MRRLLRGLALSCALLAPSAAVLAAPPPQAPAHGYRAQQHYIYYPQKQIYYAPDRQLWFWLDGGNWSFGATLPMFYQQYTRNGYSVYLDVERPYEAQERVVNGLRRHEWQAYRYGGPDAPPPRGPGPKK